MKEFSLEGFAAHLAGMAVAVDARMERDLDRAAQLIQDETKSEIGTYQDGVGPFAPWAELADGTKDQRVALGYTENDPGLRSGEMRASIERTVIGPREAEIGSDDQNMVYFELGTSKQPPRSALGGAAVRKTDEVLEVLGDGFVSALVGEDVHLGRMNLVP